MIDYPPRTQIVNYLRSALYGPLMGEDEAIEGTPFLRYMTGMLFPVGEEVTQGASEVTATAEEAPPVAASATEVEPSRIDEMELAFEALPSAVGLSFKVPDSASLKCSVWAAKYVPQAGEGGATRAARTWERRPLATEASPDSVTVKKDAREQDVLGGVARIVPRWRTRGDGTAIVTITVVNNQAAAKRGGLDAAQTLFQVGLKCEASAPGIMPYPEIVDTHGPKSEDSEVVFLYREAVPYARGHGAAATWDQPKSSMCRWVAIDYLPAVDVPYPTFKLEERFAKTVDARCLDLQFLDEASRADVLRALGTLVGAYGAWVANQSGVSLLPGFAEISKRLVDRAQATLARLKSGVRRLREDDVAWKAFRLANRAMGFQMVLMRNLKHGPYPLASRPRAPKLELTGLSWRPFQIAFVLVLLDSLLNEDSADRDIIDVIWFPTGGGKTEAYLFVTALELVRRRLVHGASDGATAVLSRYTMRLLTAQQFQRTSALMVSLELLRKSDRDLGERRFTLGLWVGLGLTENSFREAHKVYLEQLESATPENKFVLLACPYCGTEIFPSKPTRVRGKVQPAEVGIISTQSKFAFRCPNIDCEFNGELPLIVIDEALYKSPPSMLLGTIDKFAMLAWDDRARVFFGGLDDRSVPPSLVIQDELHLISGPLGSLAAPYEAAVDMIIRTRGAAPKRIGSTATIRNAAGQVKGLYGRDVAVFPSPCGRWDNAFFFSTNRAAPGRKYMGVMGQGYIKPVVAMVWTAAGLLQSVKETGITGDALDSYWTLLAYHNSRRELGRTLTAARDEVPARMEAISSSPTRLRKLGEPLELSAQMVKSMSEALVALERKHLPSKPAEDLVPCTSIISVGVDVDRLGLMLVNGQPKLTSEYIQATSRVGRGDVPGLVVTLFSPSKPRDRSHYEDFRAYHGAIYRHIEPTSVTPYALPARERTLHAALVVLVRHALKWHKHDAAGQIDSDAPELKAAVEGLLTLMGDCDQAEDAAIRAFAAQRIKEWVDFAEANNGLLYENVQAGAQFPALLYPFGKPGGLALWPTMMSVRNVDEEILVSVR